VVQPDGQDKFIGETVHTAVWKRSVSGRRMARRLNLDGRSKWRN